MESLAFLVAVLWLTWCLFAMYQDISSWWRLRSFDKRMREQQFTIQRDNNDNSETQFP